MSTAGRVHYTLCSFIQYTAVVVYMSFLWPKQPHQSTRKLFPGYCLTFLYISRPSSVNPSIVITTLATWTIDIDWLTEKMKFINSICQLGNLGMVVAVIFYYTKRWKVPTFIYRRLQGNPNSSGLQFEVAYWPALALGGTAQLVATQCSNKRVPL